MQCKKCGVEIIDETTSCKDCECCSDCCLCEKDACEDNCSDCGCNCQ